MGQTLPAGPASSENSDTVPRVFSVREGTAPALGPGTAVKDSYSHVYQLERASGPQDRNTTRCPVFRIPPARVFQGTRQWAHRHKAQNDGLQPSTWSPGGARGVRELGAREGAAEPFLTALPLAWLQVPARAELTSQLPVRTLPRVKQHHHFCVV